jgi:hypothetical protein
MSFSVVPLVGRIVALAGLSAFVAGCSGGTTPAAGVGKVNQNAYGLAQTINFANWPPAATANPAVSSFDISFVDPSVNQYYVADRNNGGVSVISTQTYQFQFTAGAGHFAGFKPNGPGNAPATNAGPNGIVPIGGGIVFAGDGDSTLKVVNVSTGAFVQAQTPVNPYTGPALPTCGAPTGPTGPTNQRLDEMAFDPADGVVLAINDASCPPFGTFFSTTAPYAAIGTGIAFTTSTGGAEQPTWDPTQKVFLEAIPSTTANPGGEVDLISPTTHAITKVLPEPSNCQANGTALGPNETLFLGCSSPGVIVTLNAATGATINTISGTGGCDEVWYNPTANRFYAGCSNNTIAGVASPVVAVADGNGNLITTIPTSTGAHSVAVDPNTDHIFVPTQKLGVQVYSH